MTEWQPIETAPTDGTVIELRGIFHHGEPGAIFVVRGGYVSEFTEGWETEKGTPFIPAEWRLLDEK